MIKDNLGEVYRRISSACSKIGLHPECVTVVAVSKGRTPDEIEQALEAGITEIGENRVQEAILKFNKLEPNTHNLTSKKWHMVGHLQTNKVKQALKVFDLIQSVDNLHLALEIDRQSQRLNKIQDILIEIKTSFEATKFGVKPEEAIGFVEEIAKFKNINIKGFMTIAPFVDNPEKTRIYFRQLRELMDKINMLHVTPNSLHVLSMGMTDDFEIAIEEGSTMVRLGRAIFETQK